MHPRPERSGLAEDAAHGVGRQVGPQLLLHEAFQLRRNHWSHWSSSARCRLRDGHIFCQKNGWLEWFVLVCWTWKCHKMYYIVWTYWMGMILSVVFLMGFKLCDDNPKAEKNRTCWCLAPQKWEIKKHDSTPPFSPLMGSMHLDSRFS